MKNNTCPNCGSTDIIPDLIVYETGNGQSGPRPIYVELLEPEPAKRPFIWSQGSERTGLRASMCGACGYTELFSTHHAEMWAAYKKGYKQASA